MRRGAGISGLARHTASTASYASLSSSISSQQLTNLESQLEAFKTALITFSKAHNQDIKKDPALRHQFQKMCAAIGVDPLVGSQAAASSRGGRLGSKLGAGAIFGDLLGMGDWTYELAVQIVDLCVSYREINGGMMEMSRLLSGLHKTRQEPSGTISEEDVKRAIKVLQPLGAGYEIVQIPPSQTFVRSMTSELDTDQATLLGMAATGSRKMGSSTTTTIPVVGRLNEQEVVSELGWSDVRTKSAFDAMVKRDGLAWVDDQVEGGMEIWVPSTLDWLE